MKNMISMKLTRLYTGDDNQSHFELVDISMTKADSEEFGFYSTPESVENIIFGRVDSSKTADWHNPPQPQYIVILKGCIEIEVGSGEKMQFKQGDIIRAEDVTGQGHVTRPIGSEERQYMAIPFKK